MRNMKSAAGMLSILMPALLALAPVQGAVITNLRFPISGDPPNDCNGETVSYSGVAHLVITTTINNNTAHLTLRFNLANASGTGSSGTKYRLTDTGSQEVNIGLAGEETVVETAHLIGRGPANNATLKMRIHITVNANGEVTADNFSLEFLCSNG